MAASRLRPGLRSGLLSSLNARRALYAAAALGAFVANANAATVYTYTGANAGDIGTSTNYTPAGTPSAAAGDTIVFNGNTPGALTLAYAGTGLNGAGPGLTFSLTASQTSAVSIDSGSNTGAIRVGGVLTGGVGTAVTIANGAGAFTLGDGLNTFNINVGTNTISTQTFTNNSANVATINSDVVLSAGGGVLHTLLFNGTGAWTLNNVISNVNFAVNDSGSLLTMNGANSAYTGGTIIGTQSTLRVNATQGLGTGVIQLLGGANTTANLQLSGNISLSNAVTFNGRDTGVGSVGLENVSGNNTMTGAFTANTGGTFYTIQSDAGLLTLSNTAAFSFPSAKTLVLQGAGNGVFNAPITQANNSFVGGLIKGGAGTWSLGGTSTFTGSTAINNGALTLTGSASVNNTSGITVNGPVARFQQNSSVASTPAITLTQGTVAGTGTVGAVTVGTGTGATVANGNNSSATLTLASLTYSGTGIASLTIQGGSNTTSTALAVTGALSTSGTPSSVTVNVTPSIAYINGDTYNLIGYGTYPNGTLADFTLGTVSGLSSRQSATLGQTSNDITLTVSGDSPKWTGLDNGNWQVGTTGPNHNFRLITAGTPTDYIEGDNVLFDDSATGTTSISISAANVSPSATTFNNTTKAYTVSGPFGIAGTGGLAMTGGGSLTINSTNSYTGATTIAGGTLTLNGTIGASGGTAIANSSNFVESNTGVITGTSSLATLAGKTILEGANSYTGITTISAGATLQLGDGIVGDDGTIAGTSGVTDNGSLVYNRAGNATAGYVVSGTGSVTMMGTGTQTLAVANTYSGGTTVAGGTLTQGVANAFSSGSSTLTVNGGVVNLNGIQLTTGVLTGTGGSIVNDGSNGVVLTAGSLSTSTSTYSGVIADNNNGGTGTISFIKSSGGILTLAGANTFSGPVSITGGGTLNVSSINSVVGGIASSNLGTPTTAVGGVINITGNGGGGALVYTGPGETTDRVLAISGGTAGSINAFIDQSGTGLLRFTSNLTVSPNIVHTLTLQGSTAGNGQIDGTIPDGVNGGTIRATTLVKAGSDTWTLTGADTYTGTTTISAGTLSVDSSTNAAAGLIGSTSVTVAGGASLHLISTAATGTTTLLSDAATLTLSNPTGPAVYLDLNGQTEAVASFFIGTTAQPAGVYSMTSAPVGSEADEVFFVGTGSLTVGAVPEPASVGLLVAAGALSLARRRRRR